ncbi:hypothetical protein BDV25DRAFT_122070 [Aspergillus avenaceus]|uniref:DUF7136 domain-containing protein n=1 Tax=Aspergillus avenaceus TaxID=36643 RepID=A0A5N6TTV3_ASPAV|nr:hypothetical protein BDV25DRAFT_122070 [Aspergillus avenaceus]
MSLVLLLCYCALLTFRCADADPYTPQTIELDLVFPRNDTYTRSANFPIIMGLQNAQVAWPQGVLWDWKLERLDEESLPLHGTFPPRSYYFDNQLYTRGEAPSDPFFHYHFPADLQDVLYGQWRYSWRFGFWQNCSFVGAYSRNNFRYQPHQEIIFSIGSSGRPLDLQDVMQQCPGVPVALEITDSILNVLTGLENCPVVNETAPTPNPCALKLNQTIVDNITATVEEMRGCKRGSLANLTDVCESAAPRVQLTGGPGLLAGLLGMVFFLFLY